MKTAHAFTLIELIIALAGGAVILTAIYSVLTRAVHLRDEAMRRTRESRVEAHAVAVLRNDLLNARITEGSGVVLASQLSGSPTSHSGGFPGDLKFTTTTARDEEEQPGGDIQEVEYYVTADPNSQDSSAGLLVRTVQRDLLTEVRGTPTEEPLLSGVQAMELAFYDGTDWQTSWDYDAANDPENIPQAVRVRLQLASANASPRTVEVLTPWTTQVTKP